MNASIKSKAIAALDEALDSVRTRIKSDGATASDLRELLALCKAAKVDISLAGVPMSEALAAVRDPVLESMRDLDPSLLQ